MIGENGAGGVLVVGVVVRHPAGLGLLPREGNLDIVAPGLVGGHDQIVLDHRPVGGCEGPLHLPSALTTTFAPNGRFALPLALGARLLVKAPLPEF